MYAYVRNNPTTLIDPTGLYLQSTGPMNALRAHLRAAEAQSMEELEEYEQEREAGQATLCDQSGATGSQPVEDDPPAEPQEPERVDKDKVADYIDEHAKGTDTYGRHCAGACHEALEAGGLTDKKDRPGNANDNGPYLVKHGAVVVAHGDTVKLPKGYKPQKADIAVFEGDRKQKDYRQGHMQIYDGKQWVSDTRQSAFTPNRQYWP